MVIVLAVIAVRQHSRNKAVFFCILFFFGTLLPTSNLFPKLGEPFFKKESWVIGSIMAERFLYMPSIGFAGCLVLAVYALARKITAQIDVSEWAMRTWLQVIARGTLVVIIVAYGVRTAIRNMDWENDVKLWTAAVKVCPNSFKTHKSLAYALYETDPEGKNIDRIIEEGEKAVAVMETRNLPDIYKTSIVYLHLGAYYRIKGDTLAQRAPDGTLLPTAASAVFYQKSADALTKAVPVDRAFNTDNRQKELRRGKTDDQIPDIGNHEVYWNLGLSYMRLGKYDEALDAYLYMRHLTPANPDAYLSIASAHLSANRLEEAAVSLIQTLLIDNNRQEAMRLIVEIYRQIDKNNCAVLNTPTGPALNSDCAIVRSNMCAAFAGLSKVFLDNRQKQIATSTAQTAISTHKCPPEPFLQFLPGIVPSAP
jgi:tetratricopeptide (TPR) repeat protein